MKRLPHGEITLQEIAEFYPALAFVAGRTLRLNPVDPETAEWLDGPPFVKWLHRHGYQHRRFEESVHRRMVDWKNGLAVSLDYADRLLTELNLSLHDLPDEMWVRPPTRATPRSVPPTQRQAALKRVRRGERPAEVAMEFGITPRTIKNWMKDAA